MLSQLLMSTGITALLLPFLVTLPAWYIGRRLWFKGIPRTDMLDKRGGRQFAMVICFLHIMLMVALYRGLFF